MNTKNLMPLPPADHQQSTRGLSRHTHFSDATDTSYSALDALVAASSAIRALEGARFETGTHFWAAVSQTQLESQICTRKPASDRLFPLPCGYPLGIPHPKFPPTPPPPTPYPLPELKNAAVPSCPGCPPLVFSNHSVSSKATVLLLPSPPPSLFSLILFSFHPPIPRHQPAQSSVGRKKKSPLHPHQNINVWWG